MLARMSVLSALGCGSIFDGHTSSIVMNQVWFAPLPTPYGWPGVPGVGSGTVLVGIAGGIAAFDERTGSARWTASIWSASKASFSGNVVVYADAACIADFFGVGCADVATGRVRWTTQDDRPTQRGQSTIDAVALYYGTADHTVVARDLGTGKALWVTDIDPGTTFVTRVFGVTLNGDTLLAATVRWLDKAGGALVGDLIALDRKTGRELWRYTAPSRSAFQGAPVVAGNLAVMNDVESHRLVAVDLTTRQEAWHTDVRPDGYITAETPPILVGDTFFVGSTDTQVYALDARTGAYRWRVTTQAGSIGNTAVCGRLVLVVPFSGGPLSAVDRVRLRADRPTVLRGDELTGGIAVSGTTAYATGTRGLYALSCPE
jgi:outer membrane protein assembly factor BamB